MIPIDGDSSKRNVGRKLSGFFLGGRYFYTINLTKEVQLWKKVFSKNDGDARQAKLKEICAANNRRPNESSTINHMKKHCTYDGFWVSDGAFASLQREQNRGKQTSSKSKIPEIPEMPQEKKVVTQVKRVRRIKSTTRRLKTQKNRNAYSGSKNDTSNHTKCCRSC
jgi:hypothetical protein